MSRYSRLLDIFKDPRLVAAIMRRPPEDCEPVKIDRMTGLPYGEIPGPEDERSFIDHTTVPDDFRRFPL